MCVCVCYVVEWGDVIASALSKLYCYLAHAVIRGPPCLFNRAQTTTHCRNDMSAREHGTRNQHTHTRKAPGYPDRGNNGSWLTHTSVRAALMHAAVCGDQN
jgi:hypothetical protein